MEVFLGMSLEEWIGGGAEWAGKAANSRSRAEALKNEDFSCAGGCCREQYIKKAAWGSGRMQLISVEKLVEKVYRSGTAARLSRAAFPMVSNMNLFNRRLNPFVHGDSVLETVENFIGRILQPRIRLVQFAGRLGGQLAQLVAVRNVCKCSKN
jgi:hypothetical protein